jgi:hypothetical protein
MNNCPFFMSSAGVVAWAEDLRGRMSEAGRQVEGLFESLLSEAFDGAGLRMSKDYVDSLL